jgi:hypothetical protein
MGPKTMPLFGSDLNNLNFTDSALAIPNQPNGREPRKQSQMCT